MVLSERVPLFSKHNPDARHKTSLVITSLIDWPIVRHGICPRRQEMWLAVATAKYATKSFYTADKFAYKLHPNLLNFPKRAKRYKMRIVLWSDAT